VHAFLGDRVQDVTTAHAQSNAWPFRARDETQELPALREGDSGLHQPELHEGQTRPPRPYTENTLLAAMKTAGRSIDDGSCAIAA
jgi:DNA topoisomerase IA